MGRIKRLYRKGKAFYDAHYGSLIVSAAGSLVMAILQIPGGIRYGHLYWPFLIYFSLVFFTRLILLIWRLSMLKKEGTSLLKLNLDNSLYLNIASLVISLTLPATYVFLLYWKDTPFYALTSIVFAYAMYAFLKTFFAIRSIVRSVKSQSLYEMSLSVLSMMSALYTLMALTVALNAYVANSNGNVQESIPEVILISAFGLESINVLSVWGMSIFNLIRFRKEKEILVLKEKSLEKETHKRNN